LVICVALSLYSWLVPCMIKLLSLNQFRKILVKYFKRLVSNVEKVLEEIVKIFRVTNFEILFAENALLKML